MIRVLLIEDEHVIRRALRRFLERRGMSVHDVPTIDEARSLSATALHDFDVVLADLRLPGEPGTAIIASVDPCPVVIMTSHASVRSAVEVMKSGASDYIAKPFDHEELLLVLERAMQRARLGARAVALEQDLERLLPASLRVEGTSLATLSERLQERARHGSSANTAVAHFWLWGATGSGREAVARAVHARSSRAAGPLVVADLATGSGGRPPAGRSGPLQPTGNGLEAVARLRTARNGTLVLRHPECMSEQDQTALARRITVQVGSETSLHVIADSSLDALKPAIAPELASLFGAHHCVRVPPLDQRRGDIGAHTAHVLDAIRARTGLAAPAPAPAALDWLSARAWPGQVLELEQLVARAALLAGTRPIERAHLSGLDTAFDAAPDLEGYFRWFVINHQPRLSETELAQRLGISRKALWERRQRSGLVRSGNDAGRTAG